MVRWTARPVPAWAAEAWVSSVTSGREWSVSLCRDWLVTVACGTNKGAADPRNATREHRSRRYRHVHEQEGAGRNLQGAPHQLLRLRQG
jgi:hypothetical protein